VSDDLWLVEDEASTSLGIGDDAEYFSGYRPSRAYVIFGLVKVFDEFYIMNADDGWFSTEVIFSTDQFNALRVAIDSILGKTKLQSKRTIISPVDLGRYSSGDIQINLERIDRGLYEVTIDGEGFNFHMNLYWVKHFSELLHFEKGVS